jgi:pimeloyl-ACP methyl ester carboxylesterase
VSSPVIDTVEYPFAAHWLAQAGGRLHYVDEGPRAGDVVLCLHGNPTWSFFYRKLVLALSDTRRVIAPDHLGCGLSDKPGEWSYTLAAHIENLERLVLALDLRRITLVLHDWGGAIGMGFARRQPERIARLVILNTAAFKSSSMPWRIRVCRTPLLGRFLVRRMNGFARLATRMAVAHKPLAPSARLGLLAPYRSSAERVAIQRFVEDIPMRPGHPSWNELEAIDRALAQFSALPACIVWGERDWCFTPRFREEWMRRFPQAEVHKIADAGHYLLEDAPVEVAACVQSFLTRHPLA